MDFLRAAQILDEYRARGVTQVIDPDDHMWNSGRDWYHSVGESGLLAVLHGVTQSRLESPTRVLDLPCGHGRVGRYLASAFQDAEFFWCDIDKKGVDFCKATFGGTGIYSVPDLGAVELPPNLDVIWVGSLFTHVDQNRVKHWLKHLARHLAPNGVIVATFHGLFSEVLHISNPMIDQGSWKSILAERNRTGFGYASYGRKDLGDYGVSLALPSKIMEIATSIEGTRVLSYTERGWAGNHDVLTLTHDDRLKPFD
jgi:SAM-dependent methyltransferase